MPATFGSFVKQMRQSRHMAQTDMAASMDISCSWPSDIEADRRKAFDAVRCQQIIQLLGLTPAQQCLLYDLAGQSRETVPPDIEQYIRQNSWVKDAVRFFRDTGMTKADWQKMLSKGKATKKGA